MENPGVLLRRARLGRRLWFKSDTPPMQKAAQDEEPRALQFQSSHSSYTALMRSHDRMRTRHIGGQGGRNGA